MTARTTHHAGYRTSDAKLRAELAAVRQARAAERSPVVPAGQTAGRVIACDVYMLDGTCHEWRKVGEAVLRRRRAGEGE